MITKSGTNNYHGSVFGFFRNDAMQTAEKVPDGTGGYVSQHPSYSHQNFGGSVGGPFIKDRLFGFFAIERERESTQQTEDPKALTELTLAKQAGLAAQPAASIPRPFYEWRYNGRMDWTINNRNSAYVSYSSQANNSLNDQSNSTYDLTEGNFTTNHLQIANVTVTSQLSNTAVNQFTAGFQYWRNFIGSDISAPLVTFPAAQFGTNGNVPQLSVQRKWQFKDDFSKTVGSHTLKAGFDYIWNPVEGGYFEYNSTLEVDFLKNPSDILNNPALYPQGFATPGLISGMSYSNGDPTFLSHTKQVGLYFQDDWKATHRLTLNLGLRWDKDINVIGESSILGSRTYQELKAINSPYVAKLPHDDNKDFSPRVGFAYDITGAGRHVVRGGFGLYFGNSFQNIPLFMQQQANPTLFQTVLSISNASDPVPCTGLTLGQWQYGVSPAPCLPPPSTQLAPGSVGRLMDPNYRNPVSEEFNLGYTWAVNNNSAVEVEYTHVLGLHQNKTINIDQKVVTAVDANGYPTLTRPLSAAFTAAGVPVLNSVRDEASINRNRYDGLNFSYRQRMTHNFTLNANYTLSWAKGYDAGGGSFRNYARDSYHPLAPWEWGPSLNDERHHIGISGVLALPKGFQIAPILQFGSARPYSVANSSNALNTGGGSANAVLVPNDAPTNWFAYAGKDADAQKCYYVTHTCHPAQWAPLRGDPFFQLDMRLAKNIKVHEGMNLQLVAQAFNLTNRANYGANFGNDVQDASTFGHPAGFINPSSTFTPRSIWGEFGVHFTF
ncbi:MAG: TonB-dependent receptor domain-containing protein [Terriglobales bacterium]